MKSVVATALLSLLATQALAQAPGERLRRQNDPHPDRTYAAVVVGITSYASLPDQVELDFARSDAATVAGALQDGAKYDYTVLMTDREATRERLAETLRVDVAQYVGPEDTLLVYFAGHGVGADLGLPTLLAHDSTLANGQEDGFPVGQLASDVATWTRAGVTIFVTDAVHKNQLDGISFFGPAADQWPAVGPNTLIVSSSAAGQPAKDGVFGLVFADAMAGAADIDLDRSITVSELKEYLSTRLTGTGQTATFGGTAGDDLVVAKGVVPGSTATGDAEQPVVYEEYEVHSAKFVFRDGASPTVQCPGEDIDLRPCDPTCYVRGFQAGPCKLRAIHDGKEVSGVTLALVPGVYDCGLRSDDTLSCIPPQVTPDMGRRK